MAPIIPESEVSLQYARSGGSGGQNVNKVSSKVMLRWNPSTSLVLSPEELGRIRNSALFQQRSNAAGEILISADEERSQEMNRRRAFERLQELVERMLFVPKRRKKTKPSRSSKERRLKSKAKHGEKKKNRNWME